MKKIIVKYGVSPALEKEFTNVIMEMTNHEAHINSLYSWRVDHEDEIDIRVNFDFHYANQEYVHGFTCVQELREWLQEVMD